MNTLSTFFTDLGVMQGAVLSPLLHKNYR